MGAPSRVTKGHCGAVFGLMLAGISFTKASAIIGVSCERLRPYVPEDWRRSPMPLRVREMTPDQHKIYRKLIPVLGRRATLQVLTA
ncbi:hypothetical protein [Reyranella sp.]|uniref:hypothetical protein n=1 Tax=Reyranella sp. TaxID=1929291 RepID=UPI0040372611